MAMPHQSEWTVRVSRGQGQTSFELIRLAAVMAEIRVDQDLHLHKQELWLAVDPGGLSARPSFTPWPQESACSAVHDGMGVGTTSTQLGRQPASL